MMLQILTLMGFLAGSPAADGFSPSGVSTVERAHDVPRKYADRISGSIDADKLVGPWPGFRQNAAHTGRTSSSGPLRPWKTWTYDMGGSTYSSPAVGEDGTVYIGSADSVYAIRPDGRRRWATAIGGYAISSPAIGADGTIYVGSRDGNLYAFEPRNGRPTWPPFETGDEIWSSPTIAADGTIYVGSFDGNLYALNPSTGTPRWAFRIGSKIVSSPAVATDGTIYVGALDNRLYAINPDGSGRWSFATGGDVASSPAIGPDGTIYVGSLDGGLYAVRPNGAARWEMPFRANDEIVSSPAIGADGTIYVGSVDGNLYAVRPDGSEQWTFAADREIYSSPAVDAQGTVYVGSYDGWLYAVQADGTRRWSMNLGNPIWSSPAIGAEHVLYVATTDGDTTAVGPFSGHLHAIGSVAVEVSFRTDPLEGEGQVVEVLESAAFTPNSGRLFYRRGGERQYRGSVPLRTIPGGFEGDIPAEDVTLRGIQYYIELTDGNTTVTYPPDDPRNHPAVRSVRLRQSLAADINLSNARYSMVSVPVVADDPTLKGVLEDDYGPYEPSRWRVLRWEHGVYREHASITANLTPGTAVFLIVRNGSGFDVDGGEAVDPSTPYRIALESGWNQVANPFAFPVALEDIQRNEAVVSSIAYWDGTEMCQEPSCLDVWQPWEGYFVLNTSDEPVNIFVRPVEAQESHTESRVRSAFPSAPLVRLVASVRGSMSKDSQNWVGFRNPEEDGIASELLEAPPFGEHVRLSVTDGDSRYARLLQPLNAEGAQWELELEFADEGDAVVEVSLIEEEHAIPDRFQAYVLDRDYDEVIPIIDGRFTVNRDGADETRRLALLVGTESFREGILGDTPDRASSFTLDQNYPNPFNPETTIGYFLPHTSHVVLDVFDVTGRRVRRLVAEAQDAGYHKVVWKGLSDTGDHVASGVYVYRLETGTSKLTKTMLLLR